MNQRPEPAIRCRVLILSVALAGVPLLAFGDSPQSPDSAAWQRLRPQLYGTRDISEAGERVMRVEGPASTPDPSATPVTIHFGQGLAGRVKQLRVVIDNNPSPVAMTLNLESKLPVDEVDLRVRIDRFTSVRAIAETDDGHLEMSSTWINASGGCAAPSSAAGGGTLGQIRFRPSNDGKALQISIRHPNNSGFQIDPRTGDAIPPHFIAAIRLRANGEPLLEAQTGISLSENPTLRIAALAPVPAPLTVEATDLPTQARYTAIWKP